MNVCDLNFSCFLDIQEARYYKGDVYMHRVYNQITTLQFALSSACSSSPQVLRHLTGQKMYFFGLTRLIDSINFRGQLLKVKIWLSFCFERTLT